MYLFDRVDQSIRKAKSNTANLITIGNLSFGCAAIMAILYERPSFAVLFIFISALLDRFDGLVARKLNQESELGKQLDSMSDIISFGVAPALLLFEIALHTFGMAGSIVTIVYMASGAFRLARFNATQMDGFFVGLPITAAGTFAALSYFALNFTPHYAYMFLTLILSFLMISTIQIKKY